MRIVLACLAVASTVFAEPPRRRVHIDHLDPAKVGQFEQARKDWVAWIAAHHVADPWGGTMLQVGGSTFLTVRSFTTWAELDAKPVGTLDPKAQKTYNDRSDDALVPPHHSEIWVREPELDYAANRAPADQSGKMNRAPADQSGKMNRAPADQSGKMITLAGFGTITYEDIKLDDTYEKAWAAIQKELVAAKYPIERIAFFSQYGSGMHVSLWLAPTQAVFAAAPSLDQVLAKRMGKVKADALLARWRGAVVARDEKELVVRADLSN